MLASLLTKRDIQTEQAPAVAFDETLAQQFVQQLPFELTTASGGGVANIHRYATDYTDESFSGGRCWFR